MFIACFWKENRKIRYYYVMKNSLKILALGLLVVGFSVNANAQTNSANAAATATVKKALTIEKVTDLAFGTFAGKSTATSDVVISNAGARSGSADMIGTAGIAAAQFTITGENNQEVAITLPTADITLSDGATHSMTIDDASFNCDKTVAGIALSGTGTLTINVGATLSVGINQFAGDYTGTFAVSVNYN